jgi:hypothetical protein
MNDSAGNAGSAAPGTAQVVAARFQRAEERPDAKWTSLSAQSVWPPDCKSPNGAQWDNPGPRIVPHQKRNGGAGPGAGTAAH